MSGVTGLPIRTKVCLGCGGEYLPRSGAQRRCLACRCARAAERELIGRGRRAAEQAAD